MKQQKPASPPTALSSDGAGPRKRGVVGNNAGALEMREGHLIKLKHITSVFSKRDTGGEVQNDAHSQLEFVELQA
jgi:hypothetical protein